MHATRPLSERVGIFQGRLVPSTNGSLQCSPGARWRDEFTLASDVGLSHIELLAERTVDPSNPLWSPEGRAALRGASAETGVAIVSMCSEECLDLPVSDPGFGVDVVRRIVGAAEDLALELVVLPLFEASGLDRVAWDPLAEGVRVLADALDPVGTRVVLECPLSAAQTLRFLDVVGSRAVGVCYDLGNATAMGFDPVGELPALEGALWHLHAKDKDADGTNVRFGRGLVDFAGAFRALAAIGYAGRVTIEATRGDDPAATAAEHRAFLMGLERP